jgi:hypothetical protein
MEVANATELHRKSGDVGYHCAFPLTLVHPTHLGVNIPGFPHLAKNERDTRISCTRHQTTATGAAFIEESRMKCAEAASSTVIRGHTP